MKKIKLFIITINIVGIICQYGLSLSRSDNGLEVSKLNVMTQKLEKENRELNRQYLEAAGLPRIQARAQELNLRSLPSTTLAPITVAKAFTY